VLIGIIFFAYRGFKETRLTPWGRVVLPFLAILLTFYLLFNLPAYYWYYAPFIFLFSMFAVAGVPKSGPALTIAVTILVAQAITNVYWIDRQANDAHEYTRVASWLSGKTSPDATVASCEIGEIGWRTPRYIIDILGLTTPKNAVYVAHRDTSSWLEEDQPDFVVVHKPAWRWEKAAVQSSKYQEAPFESRSLSIFCKKGDIGSASDADKLCAKLR
jgi:arabinofuranosyltransferase